MKVLLGVSLALFCNVIAEFTAENSISTRNGSLICEGGKKKITIEDLCNDKQDCADNWDEALCDCTEKRPCGSGNICRKYPQNPSSRCEKCKEGYEFDGVQCRDINECEAPTACSDRGSCLNFDGSHVCITCPKGFEAKMHNERYLQFLDKPENYFLRKLFLCDDLNECSIHNHCASTGYCVNQVGSFSCECPPHHEPKGNVCRAVSTEAPMIVIAENTSLLVYDLHSTKLIETVKVKQVIIDVIAYKNSIFYAFATEIWEYKFDTKSRDLVVEFDKDDSTIMSIRKLALDWDKKRLYFLTGNSIHVVDFFGNGGPIFSHKDTITDIAVDAKARHLFFSERNEVWRYHLDGSEDSGSRIFAALPEIENKNIPTGQALVADPNLQRLYFIYDRVLYSFDYEGGFSQVVSVRAPLACIEPFEDRIYGVYRASAVNPVSLLRVGYTIGGEVGIAGNLKIKNVKNPVALTIVSVAKFPENVGLSQPCNRGDACPSEWCFHLPPPKSDEGRCVCSSGQTEACTKIPIRKFKSMNSYSAEINSANPLSAFVGLLTVHLLLISGYKLCCSI